MRSRCIPLAALLLVLLPGSLLAVDCIDYRDYLHWVGSVDTPGEAYGVDVRGDYAYVADNDIGGLYQLPHGGAHQVRMAARIAARIAARVLNQTQRGLAVWSALGRQTRTGRCSQRHRGMASQHARQLPVAHARPGHARADQVVADQQHCCGHGGYAFPSA